MEPEVWEQREIEAKGITIDSVSKPRVSYLSDDIVG